MSKYKETILTDGGLDLATRAANGKTKFTITKATATEDDLSSKSDEDLQKLVTLPNEIQTGSITNQAENIKNSKSVVGTEILFTNEHIDKGYKVNSVGLYAKEDGSDTEILYALNTAIEPEYMPDFADQVLMQFKITMYVIVGRTENVTVQVDPTNMASKEYVDTKIADIDVNDKIQIVEINKKLQNKLVYTDNESHNKNQLTQVAEALGVMPFGLKQTDKDGNITKFLPDSDSLINVDGFSVGGGDSSGTTDPDHPSAGVDIYPGSLAKGEITERYCLWQGESKPNELTNVTFSQDVGSKMDKVGEGLTYLFHIQRTAINKGIKADITDIPFNYDPNNIGKDGYFTTISPVPAYIKAENLKPEEEQVITFNGVGEDLTTIKNHQSPGIGITFKSDKTMDIRPIQGFDNDGAADGISGYTYDVIVEAIATYSTQGPVQQIPPSINFFVGAAIDDVVLSGSSDFFENTSDGIKITFDNHFSVSDGSYGYDISNFGMQSVVNIDKKMLIVGYKYKLNSKDFSGYKKTIKNIGGVWETTPGGNNTGFSVSKKDYYITIGKGFINSNTGIDNNTSSNVYPNWLKMNVLSINPYTN